MLPINLNKSYWQWTLLLFLALIWGSSFILMKRGLESYSNLQVAALRIFISFLILIPVIIKRLSKIKHQYIKPLLVVGFVGNAIPAIMYTTAQTQISSSLAGMLNSLVPFFALLIGLVFYRTSTRWYNVLGIIIGLIGAGGLIIKDTADIVNGINWLGLLIVFATLCYGININEVKHKLTDLDGVTITSIAFLFIGPLAGIYLLFSDFTSAFATDNYQVNLAYIAMLALFSSVVALIVFNILIKHSTAIFAASVTYIIPIFAILWGMLDGEAVSLLQLFWISIIMLGVYFVNK